MPLTEPVSSLGNQAESQDGETYHVPCRRVYDLQLEAEGRGPGQGELPGRRLDVIIIIGRVRG